MALQRNQRRTRAAPGHGTAQGETHCSDHPLAPEGASILALGMSGGVCGESAVPTSYGQGCANDVLTSGKHRTCETPARLEGES